MNRINLCFLLNLNFPSETDSAVLEKDYQNSVKPLISYLYTQQQISAAICFSGSWIEWAAKKHSEVFQVLNELASKKRIEIIGSGYNNPIFPLIPPADRAGQIEKMTSLLRSNIGKRPYGINIFGSIWNQSLVTTLNSCGIDYVFLDSTLITKKNINCIPIITSEYGKNIKILPLLNMLNPLAQESGEAYIKRLEKFVKEHADKKNVMQDTDEFIITLKFSFTEFLDFLKTGIAQYFIETFSQKNSTEIITLPQIYLKKATKYTQCYVSSGMDWNIAQWASNSFVSTENKSHIPLTVYDYLNTYQQNKKLYDRMNYVNMLISQCKGKGGDKIRKQAAIEMLWKAQSGFNYIMEKDGLPAIAEKRQNAYKALNEAERLIRDANKSKIPLGTVSTFDYNSDGLNEYICQMEKFHAVITRTGGMVSELDLLKNIGNYAANLSRVQAFDEIDDPYERGIFVEHLIEKKDFQNYLKNGSINQTVFSKVIFNEKKVECTRREIQLEGKALYSQQALPVSLRKNYIITPFGITVQYILKNESQSKIEGYFTVELNFSQTAFNDELKGQDQYSADLIVQEKKAEIKQEHYTVSEGLEYMQITDNKDKIQFVIEPNEGSGLCTNNIVFHRPISLNNIQETSRTFAASLFWDISLDPGKEKEKTINLSIISIKKQKGKIQ